MLNCTVCATGLMRCTEDRCPNKQCLLHHSLVLMHEAAILDFEVRAGEVPPTNQTRNPTGGAGGFELKFPTRVPKILSEQ